MNPIMEQEEKKGHNVLPITENICAEISEFKGKTYVAIRKWWMAGGIWYRSNNGLNVDPDTFNDIVAMMDDIDNFIQDELKGKKK